MSNESVIIIFPCNFMVLLYEAKKIAIEPTMYTMITIKNCQWINRNEDSKKQHATDIGMMRWDKFFTMHSVQNSSCCIIFTCSPVDECDKNSYELLIILLNDDVITLPQKVGIIFCA